MLYIGGMPPENLPTHLALHEAQGLREQEAVAQFELGSFRNFIYLILDWESKKAAIVDPQSDLDEPLEAFREHGFDLDSGPFDTYASRSHRRSSRSF